MSPSQSKQLPQQDILERVNFLYQAAHIVMEVDANKTQATKFFGKTLNSIARRGVLKLDPSIKRSLCKKCHALLIPGVTACLRLKSKRETHFSLSCLSCKSTKRFLCRPGHQLWCNNPDALIPTQPSKKQTMSKVLPHQIYVNTSDINSEAIVKSIKNQQHESADTSKNVLPEVQLNAPVAKENDV